MGYIVYCHTFPNGKRYIGITKQEPNRRWRNGNGYIGQVVYEAIVKYGWDNIKHEILLKDLTQEQAEAKERELIKVLETDRHKNGYNVEEGGKVTSLSQEAKDNLSRKRKDYYKTHTHWNKGKHHSKETREKIGKANKGKKLNLSDEQKKALSERRKGKNNPMYGVKMPKEHQKKLQEACVRATSKPCMCVETSIIYSSIAEASRQTGINARTISYVCNKYKYYKTAGGYHWEYNEVE